MQTSCRKNMKLRRYRITFGECLLVIVGILFLPCYAQQQIAPSSSQTVKNASAIEKQIVSLIEKGQWDAADSLLKEQGADVNEKQKQLSQILQQYQELQKGRHQKQQEIFSERSTKLAEAFTKMAENDPNITNQIVLSLVQNVWKDATFEQKQELSSRKDVQQLINMVYRNAEQYYTQGRWKKARSTGVQWLTAFEPKNPVYRKFDEKLREADGVFAMLRKNPCSEINDPYTRIDRQSVRRVFEILRAGYVRPVDFNTLAQKTLNRCFVLGEALKTASTEAAYQADPNEVGLWLTHLDRLSDDFRKEPMHNFTLQDFMDLLNALLVLNAETLKLPEGFMLSMMTQAALEELDPYTVVIWPSDVKNFDKEMTGRFGGVGIRIAKEKDGLKIVSLIPGTPAMEAGLRADELILAVDGESTKEMSMQCAVEKISGPIGTSVKLMIQYPGVEEPRKVTIVRGKIVVPAVEGSSLVDNGNTQGHWDFFLDKENQIGYLRLKNFTDRIVTQVKAALSNMESQGLSGLILDVRGNGGGLLDAAITLSDMFVDNGILLKSKGRGNRFNLWKADDKDAKQSYPIVVLIDGGSASASEIVAGILGCDINRKAVLVGERTYGKGSVQEVVDLGSGNGKLKFTSAYYYLPDGEPVKNREGLIRNGEDDWGITPDVSVPLHDFERRKIRQINAERTKISNVAPDEELLQETSIREQMLLADPQLSIALLVLKVEIAISR